MTGMNAVPKELLRAAYQRKPIYLLKIPFLFGLWGAVYGVLLEAVVATACYLYFFLRERSVT